MKLQHKHYFAAFLLLQNTSMYHFGFGLGLFLSIVVAYFSLLRMIRKQHTYQYMARTLSVHMQKDKTGIIAV